MVTYPNQRIVKIHRERATKDFLCIKNENWQAASRDLGAHALRLYLYLASNADGFNLALSQRAVEDAIGMPRSTYYDQFRILENKGYLKCVGNNRYEFFEIPLPRDRTSSQNLSHGIDFTADKKGIPPVENPILSQDREINNIYPTNNIINSEKNPVAENSYPKVKDAPKQEEYHTPTPIKSSSFYF